MNSSPSKTLRIIAFGAATYELLTGMTSQGRPSRKGHLADFPSLIHSVTDRDAVELVRQVPHYAASVSVKDKMAAELRAALR